MVQENPYDGLIRVTEEIHRQENAEAVLDRVMDIGMEVLNAERGFLLIKKGPDSFEAASARNITAESISSIQELSSSVVNQVLSSREPLLTFDAQSDERFASAQSVLIHQIRSIACVPLVHEENVAGAIYFDSLTEADRFTDESLVFLEAFARQATLALEKQRALEALAAENRKLKKQISLSHLFPEIIGESDQIREILDIIDRVADSRASILIEGESGTGKELVARALHYHSSRRDNLFIPVFCAGLTESLLESELFGHKKGSFTGAIENKTGLFEEADGGTIFLDEIGDINVNIQTKLLRVIQEGEIKRVGESIARKIDVRIISATNRDLWKEVQQKNFREDLYYRLNVISVKVPALRERGSDIDLLADTFLEKFARENGKSISGFTDKARQTMAAYQWPGNIRELENTVERAVIMSRGSQITPDLLNLSKTRVNDLVGRSLKDIEKAVIIETLEMTGNHRTKAAAMLGVSRRWLQYRIKEWGLE